jgi:glycosyltransferase involved in cell wall biosynthesis
MFARPDLHFAGGAEFQQLNLARWLRDHGHEVSFVVGDFGQKEVETAEGFRFHRSFVLGEGNRKLRFLPDMLKLREAIHRSRPEVVNQRSTSFYTGQCCWFSHQCGAAFSFSLGIDYNCWPDLQGRAPKLIQTAYRWGVENAELVLAQTEAQAALMEENFLCRPEVLPNVLEIPPARDPSEEGQTILWVGSLAKRKRPEIFVELARSLPDLPFVLVGGPGEDPGYDREMKERAEGIENLEWRGFVPPSEMGAIYRKARLLVGTSGLEGMPNTYLQAWSNGVPVLSVSIDPDGVIAQKGLGEVVGEDGDLAVAVRRWMDDARLRREAGSRAREHVRERHDIESVAPLAVELFERARRHHD